MFLQINFLIYDAVEGMYTKNAQCYKLKYAYPVLQVQQLALSGKKIPVVSGLCFEKSQAHFTDD